MNPLAQPVNDPRNPPRSEESRAADTFVNLGIGLALQTAENGARLPFLIGQLLPETLREAIVFELVKRASPAVESATDRAFVFIGLRDVRTKYDQALIDTSGLKPLGELIVNTVFAIPALVAHGDTETPELERVLVGDNPLFNLRFDPIGAYNRLVDAEQQQFVRSGNALSTVLALPARGTTSAIPTDPVPGPEELAREAARRQALADAAALAIFDAARETVSGIRSSFPLYGASCGRM